MLISKKSMALEPFTEELIQPWREAIERTPLSPGPAGGPEYVATADKALGKMFVLRDGDLFLPLVKGRASVLRLFGSDVYEGVQTNSFLGVSGIDDGALGLLDRIPARSMVLIHLPLACYRPNEEKFTARGYLPFQQFFYHKVLLTGSFNEWFMRPSVERAQIRKARKGGVEIKIGGLELLDGFYQMYQESFSRWKGQSKAISHHSQDRFRRMLEMPGSGVRIALATMEEEVIASGLICVYQRTAAGLYGGFKYGHRSSKPTNLLYAEVLRSLVSRGVTEYNMGTSNGLKEVEHFKETLGAVRYHSIILCRHRFPHLRKLVLGFAGNRKESNTSTDDAQSVRET